MSDSNTTNRQLQFRKADVNDARLLWEWANDSETRANSFNVAPILWESHLTWLYNKLNDTECIIYIAENEQGSPVGQIRFDKSNEADWSVSVSIGKNYRGMGFGGLLIQMGTRLFFSETDSPSAYTTVKPANHASVRAYTKAGFVFCEEQADINGDPCLMYEIKRPV